MNHRRTRIACFILVGVLSACADSTTPEPVGGETHFLAGCDEGACGLGLECVCGVCTQPCTTDNTCKDLSDLATCNAAGTPNGACVNPQASPVCDVECSASADCNSLGSGYTCEQGACRKLTTGACIRDGVIYASGTSYMIDCNTCTCGDGDFLCTRLACSDGGNGSCVVDGVTHPNGDTWNDGCNDCECTDGELGCTAVNCDAGDPSDGGIVDGSTSADMDAALDGGVDAGLPDITCLEGVEGDFTGDVTLGTMEDAVVLRGIRHITGSLTTTTDVDVLDQLTCLQTIDGSLTLTGGANNPRGLHNLQTIGGSLIVFGGSYTTLDGLQRLQSVGLQLRIQDSALQTLMHLESLTALPFGLVIHNANLTNLEGIHRVTSIPTLEIDAAGPAFTLQGLPLQTSYESVSIVGNALMTFEAFDDVTLIQNQLWLQGVALQPGDFGALQMVPGRIDLRDMLAVDGAFQQLTSAGYLDIESSPSITDLDDFSQLATLGGLTLYVLPNLANIDGLADANIANMILINDCDALEHVDALAGVTALPGALSIVENARLVSLAGFADLVSVGWLAVNGNPMLTSLHGFEALREAGILEINGNQSLADVSAIEGVTMAAEAPDISSETTPRFTIQGNPALSLCDAEQAAEAIGTQCSCPPPQTIGCMCTGTCECTGNNNNVVCTP